MYLSYNIKASLTNHVDGHHSYNHMIRVQPGPVVVSWFGRSRRVVQGPVIRSGVHSGD